MRGSEQMLRLPRFFDPIYQNALPIQRIVVVRPRCHNTFVSLAQGTGQKIRLSPAAVEYHTANFCCARSGFLPFITLRKNLRRTHFPQMFYYQIFRVMNGQIPFLIMCDTPCSIKSLDALRVSYCMISLI